MPQGWQPGCWGLREAACGHTGCVAPLDCPMRQFDSELQGCRWQCGRVPEQFQGLWQGGGDLSRLWRGIAEIPGGGPCYCILWGLPKISFQFLFPIFPDWAGCEVRHLAKCRCGCVHDRQYYKAARHSSQPRSAASFPDRHSDCGTRRPLQ